jgi:hypothetical protein
MSTLLLKILEPVASRILESDSNGKAKSNWALNLEFYRTKTISAYEMLRCSQISQLA